MSTFIDIENELDAIFERFNKKGDISHESLLSLQKEADEMLKENKTWTYLGIEFFEGGARWILHSGALSRMETGPKPGTCFSCGVKIGKDEYTCNNC